MKRFITLLTGALFVTVLTFVNTGLILAETKDTEKKVYRDDDLSKSKIDKDQSTLNKMESEQGKSSEGTAAGGGREDEQGKMKSKGSDDTRTEEQYPPISY